MLRAWVKSHLTLAVREALRRTVMELRLQQRHRAAVAKARHLRGPLKVHLGCGPNLKPGWVNIDLLDPHADLALDLREPWPFPDRSVELIYSEHFFEHLDFPAQAEHVLRESYRVLQPGGIFSVGVPDVAQHFGPYLRGDAAYFAGLWNPKYPDWLKIPMHLINYTFHQLGEHKYAYDEDILSLALRAAGFTSIRRRDFEPELDVTARAGTLYIEGTKPH